MLVPNGFNKISIFVLFCLMSNLADHTAAGQALGYFFQLDRALSQIAKAPMGSLIGIETEDDIVVKINNGEKIHEQDKSSVIGFPFIPSKPDLWKSLCIWAEGIHSEEINPDVTQFLLVTNQNSSECIAKTISDAKDTASISGCLDELKKFKLQSNAVTKKYIDKLLSFSDDLLKKLIKNTSLICGDYLTGDALKKELISVLQIVEGEEEDRLSILNELYGWLFNRVKTFWQNKEPAWIERDSVIRQKNIILSQKIERFVNERFFETRNISEQEKEIHKLKTYVKQLKIINANDGEIIEAISDYLNSVEKRTQLAKKGYVTELQVDNMIRDLQTRWKTIARKIPLMHKNNTLEEQGQLICLETLEHNAKIGVYETQSYFLTRGSYHHLSDSMEVGWHPEFRNKLKPE